MNSRITLPGSVARSLEYVLLVVASSVLLVGCVSIQYRTLSLKQPVCLNNRIGAPQSDLPVGSTSLGSVYGRVMHEESGPDSAKTTVVRANADQFMENQLGRSNNRCIVNLTFDITAEIWLGGTTQTSTIEFHGDCYEINTH